MTLGELNSWIERNRVRLSVQTIRGRDADGPRMVYLVTIEGTTQETFANAPSLHAAIASAIAEYEGR